MFYLSDPQDGVSVNVKVWRVGDAEQDLQTERNLSDAQQRNRDQGTSGRSEVIPCYLHDLHLQVLMQRRSDSYGLQHLAEQLFLQDLHFRADAAHEPVVTQELLIVDEDRVHKSSHVGRAPERFKTQIRTGLTSGTCMPASAVWPSLAFLDSRAICSGSRQRSLQTTDMEY